MNQTTPITAFIHLGINPRREGPANCPYYFESVHQDLGALFSLVKDVDVRGFDKAIIYSNSTDTKQYKQLARLSLRLFIPRWHE